MKRATIKAANPSREMTVENIDLGTISIPGRVHFDLNPNPNPDVYDMSFSLLNHVSQSERDTNDGEELRQSIMARVKDRAYLFTRLFFAGIEREQLSDAIAGITFTGSSGVINLADLVEPDPIAITSRGLLLRLKGSNPRLSLTEPWDQLTTFVSDLDEWLEGGFTVVIGKDGKPTTRKTRVPGEKSRVVTDQIFLPSSGVFAEAVLDRSNAAEKIDLTRFWKWQDSLIPNQAPAIDTVSTDVQPSPTPTVPNNVINLMPPVNFPAPTGMTGILSALQNGSMFRDMSKSDQLVTLSTALASAAQSIASSAGTQAGDAVKQALQTSAKIGETAADLAAKTAEQLEMPESTNGHKPGDTVTERGGNIEQERRSQGSKPPVTTNRAQANKSALAAPVAGPNETLITILVEGIWGSLVDADILCALIDNREGPKDALFTTFRRAEKIESSFEGTGMLQPLKNLTKGHMRLQVQIRSDFYSGLPSGWSTLAGSTSYEFSPEERFAAFIAKQGYEEAKVTVNQGETLLDRTANMLAAKVSGERTVSLLLKASLGVGEVSANGATKLGGELSGSRTWEEALTKIHSTTREYKVRVPTSELKIVQAARATP